MSSTLGAALLALHLGWWPVVDSVAGRALAAPEGPGAAGAKVDGFRPCGDVPRATWREAQASHIAARLGERGDDPGARLGSPGLGDVEPAVFTPRLERELSVLARSMGLGLSELAPPALLYLRLQSACPAPTPDYAASFLERHLPPGSFPVGVDPAWDLVALAVVNLVLSARFEGGEPGAEPEGQDPVRLMDEVMAREVRHAARSAGQDPEELMPPDALREAALASGRLESLESLELVAAYSEALRALGVTRTSPLFPSINAGGH